MHNGIYLWRGHCHKYSATLKLPGKPKDRQSGPTNAGNIRVFLLTQAKGHGEREHANFAHYQRAARERDGWKIRELTLMATKARTNVANFAC